MSRIRVSIATHLFPSEVTDLSGPWLAEQTDALARYCDVSVLAALRASAHRDVVRDSGVRVAYRPTGVLPGSGRAALLLSALRYRAIAMRHVRSEWPQPDLLHAHFGFPDAVIVATVARRLRLPWVATLHGDDAFFLLGRPDALGRLMRESLVEANAVLCVSEPMATVVREHLGGHTPVTVVENGYDDTLFSLDPSQRPGGVLFVGTLTKVKNVDVLIRAMAALGHDAPPLLIAGEGPLRAELEALVCALGMNDRVRFAGVLSRADVACEIRRARVLAIPSSSEGFGMVAAEALACGTPVVASRVGGLTGIVTSKDSGILVEPGSAPALAAALKTALERTWDPERVATGSGARPWRERAAEVVAVYERVLDRGRPDI